MIMSLSLLDQALANPDVSLETIQSILQQQPELMGPALIGENYNLFSKRLQTVFPCPSFNIWLNNLPQWSCQWMVVKYS